MPAATANVTTKATGTSDWVRVRKGQSVNVTSTNWNSASAAMYYMAQEDTDEAHTIKDAIGGSAVAFTANDTFVMDSDGYVYMVITGTATNPIQLLVT